MGGKLERKDHLAGKPRRQRQAGRLHHRIADAAPEVDVERQDEKRHRGLVGIADGQAEALDGAGGGTRPMGGGERLRPRHARQRHGQQQGEQGPAQLHVTTVWVA